MGAVLFTAIKFYLFSERLAHEAGLKKSRMSSISIDRKIGKYGGGVLYRNQILSFFRKASS
jgi:hypothetical protein